MERLKDEFYGIQHSSTMMTGSLSSEKTYTEQMNDDITRESISNPNMMTISMVAGGCTITALLVVVAFLLCLYCKHRRKHIFYRRRMLYQNNRSNGSGCRHCSINAEHVLRVSHIENGVHSPRRPFRNLTSFTGENARSFLSTDRMQQLQAAALPSDERSQAYSSTAYSCYSRHPVDSHVVPGTAIPKFNPIYRDAPDNSMAEPIEGQVVGPLSDLFRITDRSITQTVCGKQLVSIARYVGYQGDMLILDNMGISLKVPEGAVKMGEYKYIVLVLNWDLSDNPFMETNESLVSPVVYVGPHGLKLEKPCSLIFKHCAFNRNQIRIMQSETELTDTKDWKVANVASEDTYQNDSFNLTPDECQLQIETFTLYTCVQSPLNNVIGKKWLQMAAFACPLRKRAIHHQIRVYFLNKTNCALQWAIQNEAQFGGRQICPEKVFLFDGNELDMFTQTTYLSEGWELIDKADNGKISFLTIWHGQCPHISVCFRRNKHTDINLQRDDSAAIEMTLHLFAFQKTQESNGEKVFIQLFEDDKTPPTEKEIHCNHHIDIHINNFGGNIDMNDDGRGQHAHRQRSTFSFSSQAEIASLDDNIVDESQAGTRHHSSYSISSNSIKNTLDNSNSFRNSEQPVKTGQFINRQKTYSMSSSAANVPSVQSINNLSETSSNSLSQSVPVSRKHVSGDKEVKDVKIVINNTYSAGASSQLSSGHLTSGGKRMLCHSLRKRLQILLDPPKSPCGNDWRDLAAKLELDTYIPKLQTKESPTEELLDLIEQKQISVEELKRLFQEIKRQDCASELDNYIKLNNQEKLMQSSQEATENAELETRQITRQAEEHSLPSEHVFSVQK